MATGPVLVLSLDSPTLTPRKRRLEIFAPSSVQSPQLRDAAVRKVLLKSSRTPNSAVGLKHSASDAEVRKRVRSLLRLLHPDYSLNQPLKGSKAHTRIEAAFKKLNGLRDALEGHSSTHKHCPPGSF